jgi:hypothetical protein
MECIRKLIFDNIDDCTGKANFLLLSCAWCKSVEKAKDFPENKILNLLVKPLYIIAQNRVSDDAIFKMISMKLLDDLQSLFSNNEHRYKKESGSFIKAFNDFQNNMNNEDNNQDLLSLFKGISEFTYLELLKHLIYDEEYIMAVKFVLDFYSANVNILKNGFRTRYYYRKKTSRDESLKLDILNNNLCTHYPESNLFFNIGVSLDEGLAEYVTRLNFSEASKTEDTSPMYYFEIKYIKKLIDIIGKDLVINAYYNEIPAYFFYDITKNSPEVCDYYNIYSFTDNHDWKSAINLLKRINVRK